MQMMRRVAISVIRPLDARPSAAAKATFEPEPQFDEERLHGFEIDDDDVVHSFKRPSLP